MPDRFNEWLMGVITKTLLKQQQRKAASLAELGCVRQKQLFCEHYATMRIAD
jgi:hypothetical protein